MQVNNECSHKGLLAGLVLGRGVVIASSPDILKRRIESLISQRKTDEFPPEDLKVEVRNLLRSGGFKPSGRNKPASEYLAQAAKEDRFPLINNLVDINNYVSLLTGLPISLLDLDVVSERILLRYGTAGEKYVFNEAGQEIDITGLISVCSQDPLPGKPLGNPVKDSTEGKINPSTTSVMYIVFAPASWLSREELDKYLSLLEDLLREFGLCSTTQRLIA